LLVFDHHRSTVIQNAAVQADSGGKLTPFVQILVDSIAACEDGAGDGDFIANF